MKGLGDPREMLASYRLDVSAGEGARLATEHRRDQEILLGPPSSPIEEKTAIPEESLQQATTSPAPEPPKQEVPLRRWGNRDVSITGCRLLDASGAERYAFRSGESLTIEIAVAPRVPTADFVFGIAIFTPDEVCVHGTNTEIDIVDANTSTTLFTNTSATLADSGVYNLFMFGSSAATIGALRTNR